MKTLTALIIFVFAAHTMHAQIGIGTTTPNSTLDVRGSLSNAVTTFSSGTTAGSSDNFLLFTGTSATTLTLPTAVGITGRVYWIKNASSNSSTLTVATTSSQTIDGAASWTLSQSYKAIRVVSNGSNWYVASESLPGAGTGTAWLLDGNNVTSAQDLGTTSNYDLPFITNNTEKMRITNSGNVGIGTATFNATYPERLLVDAGSTGNTNFQNVIVGKGNTNSYAQLNIQNNNAGTGVSSDVVATANNGSETINYVDMGINGGGNTSTGVIGGANTAYLYSTGNDFAIGNGTNSKNLNFFTTTGGTYTERMRIDANGNVGIGTSSPAAALHVVKSNSGGNILTLQNTNASGFSSADFYSSAGALSGTFGYANGSTGAPFTGRTYFNSYGNDFVFANGSSPSFFIEGSNNNVGVNNTSPTEKLDVTGNIRFSGALMPNNTAGTAGNFLVSTGSGSAPTWFDASGYAWLIDGNTVGAEKKFGTKDNYALPFITDNIERMRISNSGNVGIGTSTFTGANPERLIVDAGSNGSGAFQNVIVGKGNTNSYAQLNIQNTYNGTAAGTIASSDVVATADNGNETVNYIDMGINSSGNNSTGILGSANTSYLYSTGNNFAIGNATASKDVILFTGGTTATNERLRATANGLTMAGSLTTSSYHSGTGAYTILATDYVIINTGAAATWTLPAATTCAGRVYRLVNQGTGAMTLSQAVTIASGSTSTNMNGGVNYEIISDGTIWRKIN